MKKSYKYNLFVQIILILFGAVLFSAGLYFFIAPSQIVPGGLSGVAVMLNYLFGVPVGLAIFIMNIPMFLLGLIYLGKRFILKTMLSVAAISVFSDYLFTSFPVYTSNKLLACLFGGVLLGAGLGLSFMCECSTGGLDIPNMIIQKKYPFFNIGVLVFVSDFIIVSISAFVFKTIDAAMYAIVAMFVSAKVIDLFTYGLDVGKLIIIITSKGDEVSDVILKKLSRGVTKLKSTGAYTNSENSMLMCAVRTNEYYRVKRIVNEIDKSAFIITTTASEVVGDGFKALEKSI